MGWFDEQIRQRKENDERILEESFIRIADSVTGKRLADRLNDDRTVTGIGIETHTALSVIAEVGDLNDLQMQTDLRHI